MDLSADFWLAIALIVFGSFWVAVYSWALFRLGKRLASKYRTRTKPGRIYFWLGFYAAAPGVAIALFLSGWGMVAMTVLGSWILHYQALAAGYWYGLESGSREDHRRFRERAEDWLSHWETPPALREDSDVTDRL